MVDHNSRKRKSAGREEGQKKPPSVRFFLTLLPCVASVGVGVRFAGQGLFFDLFAKAFFDPFCVVGCPKKTFAVWGQVFRFLVRLFFRPFWNSLVRRMGSHLSNVWVPT